MTDAFDVDPVIAADAPNWFREALETPFERRTTDVAGCAINYLAWGEPATSDDASGLVFVHGGGAHAHWWTHVAAKFADVTRVAAIDLSGHGDSGRRESYSLEGWCDEVVAVARDAGIASPVVVGHSMGGFVTVATGARHADVVRGAVIVDSPIVRADLEVAAARNRDPFSQPPTYADLDTALSHFHTVPPQAHYLDYVMDHVGRRSLRQTADGWQWKFDPNFWKAMGDSPRNSAVPYLTELRCRVALFRCEHGLVDRDIGRSMYNAMGRVAPVVELPTSGHHAMLDTPLVLLTALRTLFADWLHSDPRHPPH